MNSKLEIEELVSDNPYVASHRLPILRSWYPRYFYHVAVVIPDPSDTLWGLVKPTDDELLMSAMYLKFTIDRQQYRERYLREMAEKAIVDIDPGFVTITLGKSEHLGWQYHKITWRHGPFPL